MALELRSRPIVEPRREGDDSAAASTASTIDAEMPVWARSSSASRGALPTSLASRLVAGWSSRTPASLIDERRERRRDDVVLQGVESREGGRELTGERGRLVATDGQAAQRALPCRRREQPAKLGHGGRRERASRQVERGQGFGRLVKPRQQVQRRRLVESSVVAEAEVGKAGKCGRQRLAKRVSDTRCGGGGERAIQRERQQARREADSQYARFDDVGVQPAAGLARLAEHHVVSRRSGEHRRGMSHPAGQRALARARAQPHLDGRPALARAGRGLPACSASRALPPPPPLARGFRLASRRQAPPPGPRESWRSRARAARLAAAPRATGGGRGAHASRDTQGFEGWRPAVRDGDADSAVGAQAGVRAGVRAEGCGGRGGAACDVRWPGLLALGVRSNEGRRCVGGRRDRSGPRCRAGG
eukprot:scaffold4545_cov111-Isochrysis_galbana.AAC.7